MNARQKRYCARCGTRVGRSATKCGYCGSRLPGLARRAAVALAVVILLLFLGRLLSFF